MGRRKFAAEAAAAFHGHPVTAVGVDFTGMTEEQFMQVTNVIGLFPSPSILCWRCYARDFRAIPPHPRKGKPCEACGRKFRAWPAPNVWVCSPACRRERDRQRRLRPTPTKRKCEGCTQTFIPTRADQRYHDAACKQRAYRKRRTTSTRPEGPAPSTA